MPHLPHGACFIKFSLTENVVKVRVILEWFLMVMAVMVMRFVLVVGG